MYFPYFRGKQYELVALREMSTLIQKKKTIIPIIEPVRDNTNSLTSTVEEYLTNDASLIVILNPQVGEFAKKQESKLKRFADSYSRIEFLIVGYIIHDRTTFDNIRKFLEENSTRKIALIHYYSFSGFEALNQELKDHKDKNKKEIYNIFIEKATGNSYRKSINVGKRIVIRDGMNIREKNSDYPDNEYFSDLHDTFKGSKFDGFGDFLIVGDKYSETGGPAYAVTIHLTYLHKTGDIWIRHFVSDRTDTPVDPAGKFLEALTKLHHAVQNDEHIFRSESCEEFLDLFDQMRYPGLGYVKKLSMKHHIELITNQIL